MRSPHGQAPQYARDEDLTRDLTAVKAAIKHLRPEDRAFLAARLLSYYGDRGMMYSPHNDRRTDRIMLNGTEYWLARVPKPIGG
jgi:hypothetical protein